MPFKMSECWFSWQTTHSDRSNLKATPFSVKRNVPKWHTKCQILDLIKTNGIQSDIKTR